MIFKAQVNKKIKELFKEFTDTLVWSCLDGTTGEIYTNDEETSASAVIADFCFLAGEPCREFVEKLKRDYIIIANSATSSGVPQKTI